MAVLVGKLTSSCTRQISGKISREHPEALALLPTLDAVRAQFGNGDTPHA